MTDLTSEQLDGLAKRIPIAPYWRGALNALIAQARRADAADDANWRADQALASLAKAERERDAWKTKFGHVQHAESELLAENDALAFIARTNGFQRDKAERERDALRVERDMFREAIAHAHNHLDELDGGTNSPVRQVLFTALAAESTYRRPDIGPGGVALAEPTDGGEA